jgi:hypothetical protein
MQTANRNSNTPILLGLLLLAGPFILNHEETAQAQRTRMGTIVGKVEDPNLARIAGARIMIQNGSFKRTLESNDEGLFRVDLPVGVYRITVEMDGFKSFEISSFRTYANTRSNIAVRMKVKPPQTPVKIDIAP